MLKKHSLELDRQLAKITGSEPQAQILRKTTKSRDGWKAKAMERRDETNRMKVSVRDLRQGRDDWIFILDHSIEFGKKQCLLVLAISLAEFRRNKCGIRHRDVEVMAVDIVESATAKSVTDIL